MILVYSQHFPFCWMRKNSSPFNTKETANELNSSLKLLKWWQSSFLTPLPCNASFRFKDREKEEEKKDDFPAGFFYSLSLSLALILPSFPLLPNEVLIRGKQQKRFCRFSTFYFRLLFIGSRIFSCYCCCWCDREKTRSHGEKSIETEKVYEMWNWQTNSIGRWNVKIELNDKSGISNVKTVKSWICI